MNKEDVKKLDEIIAENAAAAAQKATDELSSEDLKKVNGGSILRECWEELMEEIKKH